MESPQSDKKNNLGQQVRGIIIILFILVMNAAVTLLILSNRTASISETERITLKKEILNEVETLIERENENPSQICLEGDEDCNDTVDETCLVGTPDCNDTPEITPEL